MKLTKAQKELLKCYPHVKECELTREWALFWSAVDNGIISAVDKDVINSGMYVLAREVALDRLDISDIKLINSITDRIMYLAKRDPSLAKTSQQAVDLATQANKEIRSKHNDNCDVL